jgi:uncharacterized protein YgiM (DUF1202 family)
MRSGPGTNYKLLGTIAKGTKVDILATSGDWYYVQLANGTTAYIIKGYVQISEVTVTVTPTVKPTATPTAKPTATATQSVSAIGVGTVVNCNVSVNLRSGPGINYSLIGTIAKGVKVDVLTKSGDWYLIRQSNGTTAYIIKGYLNVTLAPLTTSTATTTATATATTKPTATATQTASVIGIGTVYNCKTSVNMRSGPGTNYSLVGTIAKGITVDVLAKSGDWYYIRMTNGKTAYIIKGYLNVILTPSATASATVIPTVAPTATPTATQPSTIQKGEISNCQTSVNMRSGPGTNYALLGTITKGTQVDILKKSGSWYQIRLENGSDAYVLANYVKILPQNSKSLTGTVYNCVSSVNMRSAASNTSTKIATLAKSTVVTVLGTDSTGMWYNIRLENGTTGYIYYNYLSINAAAELYDCTSMKVRSGAGTSYDSVVTIDTKTAFNVISISSNGWYKIKTSTGKTGWISSEYVSIK